jgi:glycosyltransferase involved in cell wall biosynthesis
MSFPLVSIIIPVYNGSNFIREAIESAVHQDYEHTEIIVINDGSNDSEMTERICLEYGDKVKYYRKINGGTGSALNLGLEKAGGQFIQWLSHDDILEKNKLSIQVQQIMNSENRNVICISSWSIIDDSGKNIGEVSVDSLLRYPTNLNPFLFLLQSLVHGCSLLIPRRILFEAGLFNENLKTTQDYDMWFRIFPKVELRYSNLYLVKSRVHLNQGSHSETFVDEGNELWIKWINSILSDEYLVHPVKLGDCLVSVCLHLASTPYKLAYEFSLRRLLEINFVRLEDLSGEGTFGINVIDVPNDEYRRKFIQSHEKEGALKVFNSLMNMGVSKIDLLRISVLIKKMLIDTNIVLIDCDKFGCNFYLTDRETIIFCMGKGFLLPVNAISIEDFILDFFTRAYDTLFIHCDCLNFENFPLLINVTNSSKNKRIRKTLVSNFILMYGFKQLIKQISWRSLFYSVLITKYLVKKYRCFT